MTNTDDNVASTNDNTTNEYKIWLNTKIPVNSNVKANVGLLVLGTTNDESENADTEGDGNVNVNVKNANFTYTMGKTSVTVGKQSLGATPVAADAAGTGALALSTMGPVTLAGGYFLNSQANAAAGASDIMALAAIGSFGPVNAHAWYFPVEDVLDSLMFTQVDGKFGPVSVAAQYAASETEAGVDGTLLAMKASANLGPAKLCAGYVTRGDVADSAPVTLEDDADYIDAGEQTDNAEMEAGKDTFFLKAGVKMGAIGVGAEYITSEIENGGAEVDETVLRASYAMSKNFKVSTYYSMMSTDVAGTSSDSDQARLEVKYSF
jgi:hypothetical protein